MRFSRVLATLFLATGSIAYGDITIDDFDKPNTGFSGDKFAVNTTLIAYMGNPDVNADNTLGVNDGMGPDGLASIQHFTDNDPGGSSIMGDTRTFTLTGLEFVPDPIPGVTASKVHVGLPQDPTSMNFSNDTGTSAELLLAYGSLSDGGAFDATEMDWAAGGNAVAFDILSLDAVDLVLDLTIVDANNNVATLHTVITPTITTRTTVSFAFASFDNIGAVDLTQVVGFSMLLSPPLDETGNRTYATGLDVTIDAVRVTGVPEPASLALMGLGSLLAGCGVMRRKRKAAEELAA